MLLNRKQQWIIFASINFSVLVLLIVFWFYWKYIMNLPFNKCNMVEVLHLYCPACGGTRAVGAILRFDILSAFKYNPIVPIGAAGFVVYEAVMIKHLITKTERDYFIKPWMIYVILIIWAVYFVVRNILLFCGIDLIGDIIV